MRNGTTNDKALPGDPAVTIRVRRSARARRIGLRVSALDGQVTLTLPRGASEAEGLRFAAGRSDWIRGHLAARTPPATVGEGARLDVDGSPRVVVLGSRAALTPDAITVRTGRAAGPQVAALLKETARGRLVAASDRYAGALGRDYGKITLRDTRSRWGSCTHRGDLMYSWRLILAPPEVLDYVAAHEVAHLAHLDHSAAYWRALERLLPGYAAPRRWLRDHGATLHAWRFDA